MTKLGTLSHQWEIGNVSDVAADGTVIISAYSTETERLIRVLDRIDRPWFFSDDHDVCVECREVIETQPSSWSWTPRFIFVEAEGFMCQDCCQADPGAYAYGLVDGSLHPSHEEGQSSPDIAVDPLGISFAGSEDFDELPPRTVQHGSTVDVYSAEFIREALGLPERDSLAYVVHPNRVDRYETTFSVAVYTGNDIG